MTRILRAACNLMLAALVGSAAVFIASMRLPNMWVASGGALFLFMQAFDSAVRGFDPWVHTSLLWRLRVRYTGSLVALCLCGVGSVAYGGAIGFLGAIGAFIAGSWCLWLVQQLAKAS